MARYTRTQITQLSANESAAVQQINKNLEDIQDAIQDTVSRSGQSPTQMTADLDLNGKRIINVPAPLTDNDLVRRVDVIGDIATVQELVNTASTAAGQAIAAAEGVQEAIADAHVGIVADDLMLGDDSKIKIAADNISDISTCVSNISDIQAVGSNISNVNAVADNETNINAVNSNKTNIDAVAADLSNINTVAGSAANIDAVASDLTNIGTVASNVSDVGTCATNIASIIDAPNQASAAAGSANSAAISAEQAAISAAGTHFKLFQHGWFDYELNDLAWLRADTFSWQDGTVYSDAYQHLVDDSANGTSQTETIAGHTITYTLAPDGHKIVSDPNASEVEGLYNDTGVAWYYILDLVNQKFKLPRTKYGYVGLRDAVGKYVPETLPNIKGGDIAINKLVTTRSDGALYVKPEDFTAIVGIARADGQVGSLSYDASRTSSTYQDSAPVQQRATQMYLYFYVGQYTQSATEQTAGLNAELFNGKMDLDGGNVVASAGSAFRNITNWSNNTTNCVTEIPQDIKIELNNGTLTLKADSKVCVPNGSGVFDVATIPSDLSKTRSTNSQEMYVYRTTDNSFTMWQHCYSGTTAPSGETYMLWYDTANNKVKTTGDGGSTWGEGYSLPVCLATSSATQITSIDQVFNGFGYIGSTIFVLPGVKGLIPNGRNEDGTLKNDKFETTSVLTASQNWNSTSVVCTIYKSGGALIIGPLGISDFEYNENENRIYFQGNKFFGAVIAHYDCNNGIYNWTQKTAFRSLDFNDVMDIGGPKVYMAHGNIFRGGGDPLSGYGIAMVSLFPNGIAKVDFYINVTTSGSSSSNFSYGLSAAKLREINPSIPEITANAGGTYVMYRTNNTIASDLVYYGGYMYQSVGSSSSWALGRIYNTSGDAGGWPASTFVAGQIITGTAYGSYKP